MQDRDLYIAGVSYAGHMVPNIATAIVQAIDANAFAFPLRFKGIALGNPWINPSMQYGAYSTFGVMHGLISQDVADTINTRVRTLMMVIDTATTLYYRGCRHVVRLLNPVSQGAMPSFAPTRSTCAAPMCVCLRSMVVCTWWLALTIYQ